MCNKLTVTGVVAANLVIATLITETTMLFGCGASTGKVVQDVTVAVKDVICLLDTYSTEVQSGVNDVQAGIDAASKCGVATDVATQVFAAHKAALEREARKK